MGVVNPRAICPNCGAKIHTQKRKFNPPPGISFVGALKLQVTESWKYRPQVTGKECPHCHVPLTGNVLIDNKAEPAA